MSNKATISLFIEKPRQAFCAPANSPMLSRIAATRERKVWALAAIVFLAVGGLLAGPPSPAPNLSEADRLDRQVQEILKAGKYFEAIPLANQSLRLREKGVGPERSATAQSLNTLGELYTYAGQYGKAEPLFER